MNSGENELMNDTEYDPYTQHSNLLLMGNRAFKEKRFQEALQYFMEAQKFGMTNLEEAETLHYISLTYLEMRDFLHYFQNEEMSASIYRSVDVGQSADFLKEAGDVLKIAGQGDLSRRAYELAAKYFNVKAEDGSAPGLKAWSNFCMARSAIKAANKYYEKAANLFFEEAKRSPTFAQFWNAKGYYSLAMSYVSSASSISDLEKAIATLAKILDADPRDTQTKICILIARCLREMIAVKRTKNYKKSQKKIAEWLNESNSLMKTSEVKLFRFAKTPLLGFLTNIKNKPTLIVDQNTRLLSELLGLFNMLS